MIIGGAFFHPPALACFYMFFFLVMCLADVWTNSHHLTMHSPEHSPFHVYSFGIVIFHSSGGQVSFCSLRHFISGPLSRGK
jgi:hypothetical protein